MWFVLTGWFRRWLLFTIAVPLLAAVARWVARRIEARRGSTRVSRGLLRLGSLPRRRRTG